MIGTDRGQSEHEENRLLLLAVTHTDRPIFALDKTHRIVQANRAFAQMCHQSIENIIGRRISDFLEGPRLRALLDDQDVWRTAHVSNFTEDMRVISDNPQERWVRASITPVFNETTAALMNLVAVLSDVTEERQLRRLERDVLEALTSNLSFEALGDFLCQQIESIIPGVLVALNRVENGRLWPWAAPSFDKSYGSDLAGAVIGEGMATCGSCAYRGEPVMTDDIKTDPAWRRFQHLALPPNCQSCWSYPVKLRDGTVAGTFAFYFQQDDKPGVKLERVAQASVHLCSLAIEREENQQRLNRLVQFDALTGLPNREQLHRYIDDLLCQEQVPEISFFYIGLDRFKDINNTLGHAAGDQTLLEMSNRLSVLLRDGLFLSRPEANLFVLIAPACNVHRAAQIARRIQQVTKVSIDVAGFSLDLTVSIGISHYPTGSVNRDVLLQNAKSAMDQIKEAGGADYLFFSDGMNRVARERLLLGTALRRAIPKELRLVYQPQLRLDSASLYGVEALARWHDPEFGNISPERFISLAEEIGEIEAIGHWALREACRQMHAWRDQGLAVPVVSVNLSPLSFRSRSLPAFVAKLLREWDLPAKSLTIEITESAALALTPEMLDVVQGIHQLGIGLSIDDFGTGYSSLFNLATLPVTEVKIDRGFIDQCLKEERLKALVLTVIGIGKNLNLSVVAEGVETPEQCALLVRHKCPAVQGYWFAHPMEAKDLPAWMAQMQSRFSVESLGRLAAN